MNPFKRSIHRRLNTWPCSSHQSSSLAPDGIADTCYQRQRPWKRAFRSVPYPVLSKLPGGDLATQVWYYFIWLCGRFFWHEKNDLFFLSWRFYSYCFTILITMSSNTSAYDSILDLCEDCDIPESELISQLHTILQANPNVVYERNHGWTQLHFMPLNVNHLNSVKCSFHKWRFCEDCN